MILDVGCGDAPCGDVNCDLFVVDVEGHRLLKPECYALNTREIDNFVLCDCHFLPFKSGTFELAVSRQLVEHIKKPVDMIRELIRVSSDYIIIETVHRRGERLGNRKERNWSKAHHISSFNYRFFEKLIKLLNCRLVKFETLTVRPMPHPRIPLIKVPYQIRIIFEKYNLPNKPGIKKTYLDLLQTLNKERETSDKKEEYRYCPSIASADELYVTT